MSIRVKDHGAKKLLQQVKEKGYVKVGIIGAKASAPKAGMTLGELTDNTVAEVAAKNEFGLGVPKRSFVRGYMDEAEKDLVDVARKLAKRVLQGKLSQERALHQMGLHMVGGMVDRIDRGIPPKNSDWWIEQKGSSKPLVNTGQLKSSIDYEVVSG